MSSSVQRRARENLSKTPLGSKLMKTHYPKYQRDSSEVSTEVFSKELQILGVSAELITSWSAEVKTMEVARNMNMRFLAYTYNLMSMKSIHSSQDIEARALHFVLSETKTVIDFILPWIQKFKDERQRKIKIIEFKHQYIRYLRAIFKHRESPTVITGEYVFGNEGDVYDEDLREDVIEQQYAEEISEESSDFDTL